MFVDFNPHRVSPTYYFFTAVPYLQHDPIKAPDSIQKSKGRRGTGIINRPNTIPKEHRWTIPLRGLGGRGGGPGP